MVKRKMAGRSGKAAAASLSEEDFEPSFNSEDLDLDEDDSAVLEEETMDDEYEDNDGEEEEEDDEEEEEEDYEDLESFRSPKVKRARNTRSRRGEGAGEPLLMLHGSRPNKSARDDDPIRKAEVSKQRKDRMERQQEEQREALVRKLLARPPKPAASKLDDEPEEVEPPAAAVTDEEAEATAAAAATAALLADEVAAAKGLREWRRALMAGPPRGIRVILNREGTTLRFPSCLHLIESGK